MGTNPWTYIIVFALVVVAFTLLVAVLQSFLISKVAVRYADKTHDKFVKEMCGLLPGKNCGACGYDSCTAYAEAVLHTMADENLCPHAKETAPEAMEACRASLQELLEDPTPPKERKPRFWEQKF